LRTDRGSVIAVGIRYLDERVVVMRPTARLLVASAVPALFAATPLLAQTNSTALREAVTVAAIRVHQQELQKIADANSGTRVSGSPGYEASIRYVEEKLREAGYQVVVQPFPFPVFEERSQAELARLSPEPRTYVHGTDFLTLRYSGAGTVEGMVVPTRDIVIPPTREPSSTSGCEPADFPAAPAEPAVALVQRGTCSYETKVTNAAAVGYEAIIIFNEGQDGRREVITGHSARRLESPWCSPALRWARSCTGWPRGARYEPGSEPTPSLRAARPPT
jgi:hypothetical protein